MSIKKVREDEIGSVLRKRGKVLSEIPADKVGLMKIGCQLHYLSADDLDYMSDKRTTFWMAQSRLSQRRMEG